MAFKGLVAEIPLGAEGITGTRNLARTRLGQLVTANNGSFEAGTLQKEGGAKKYKDRKSVV